MTVVELFLNPSVVFLLLLIQAFHVQGVDATTGAGDVSVLGCWIVCVFFKLLIFTSEDLKNLLFKQRMSVQLVVSLGEREAVNNCCCLILVGNSTLTC